MQILLYVINTYIDYSLWLSIIIVKSLNFQNKIRDRYAKKRVEPKLATTLL
jgi:hypothetical protein